MNKRIYFLLFFLNLLLISNSVLAAVVTDGFDDETQIAYKNHLTVVSSHVELSGSTTEEIIVDSSNLELWTKFNESNASLTLADSSINTNTGTWMGKADGDINVTDGVYGNAGFFDGTNDYVSIDDDDSLSFGDGSDDDAVSFVAWVKMDDATNFFILTKTDYPSNLHREYQFRTGANDKLYVYFHDQSEGSYLVGYDDSEVVVENQWVHLVATYDGSGDETKIRLYLNGSRVDTAWSESGSYTAMENKGQELQIGARAEANAYSDGLIDAVRIYRRELSADEVLAEFNNIFSDGIMYSTNLLFGLNVTEIESFGYDTSITGSENVDFQFSQDNSTWYNSTSLNGWEIGLDGINTVNLGVLSWDGGFFYYRANLTDGGATPELESITLTYDTVTMQSYFLVSFIVLGIIFAPILFLIKKKW